MKENKEETKLQSEQRTAEEILKDFIRKETEYLQSCNPTNEFGDITGNDFAAGVVTGMNRLYNEFIYQSKSQSLPIEGGEREWISVKDRLPERVPNKNYSQVKCLVNKRYEWKRGDNSGVFYQIQILTFNHEHECWDGEDGDDHDCDIDQVTHWMPLPPPPKNG